MKDTDQHIEQGTVRERILLEALHLFSERGFEGVSLQAIAEYVGIQKPSLLYHFSSKEVLRQEVMLSLILYWKNELPRVLTSTDAGTTRLVSTMNSLINFFVEDVSRARLVVREMLDRPEETYALLKEHFSPWTQLIEEYLRMGRQSGEYRADMSANAYIVQVMVMVVGTVAFGDTISGLIGAADSPSRGALIRELVRIVQASLYTVSKQTGRPAKHTA